MIVPSTKSDLMYSVAFPGWCVTYASPTAGSLLVFAKCNENDLNQNSWKIIDGPNGTSMECISETTCDEVNSKDRKLYLAKAD